MNSNGSFRLERARQAGRVPVGGHVISAEAGKVCGSRFVDCLMAVFRPVWWHGSVRCRNGITIG
jgi:hypothetical protein